MTELIITDEDINYSEKILGPKVCFDSQRRKVIKCMESRDVVACPGSGKTTVLLAKLIILARKMSLEGNRGICVLTHTNVAIDEIKAKLGADANILLSYPNFFGTIQSFIDKYLAIPASIKYYSVRPCRILEKEEFDFRLVQCFRRMDFRESKLHGLLYARLGNDIKEGKSRYAINRAKEEKLQNLRLDYLTKEIIINIEGNESRFVKNVDSDSYKEYWSLIETLVKRGLISYNEADGLALKYLRDFGDLIKPLFKNRFAYVFIDEMQDTKNIQNEILSNLFDKNKVVYQCFGDINQAIYDGLGADGVWKPNNPILINNSKRFSNNIAKVSDCLAIKPYKMKGYGTEDIHPTIITYKDDVTNVLECFAKLIKSHNLLEEEKPVFKAVGMVKDNKDLSITSYYNSFNKTHSKTNIYKDYASLSDYLVRIDSNIVKKNGTKVYFNKFINAVLKILRLSECKNENNRYYSKTSFLKYLHDNYNETYDEMNYFFIKCIIKLENNEEILTEFIEFITGLLCVAFNTSSNNKLVYQFISCEATRDKVSIDKGTKNNIYEYDDVKIEIDTVHGVKGESHTATLYLETKYHQYSISNIIDFLNDERNQNVSSRKKKHLKIAYVAMTRPKKLLCITMKEDVYKANKDKLDRMGWVKYNI